MKLSKYFVVFKNTWAEALNYRLNFTVWRLRMVLHLLTIYFLWLSVFPQNAIIGGYDQKMMLTYILGTSLVGALVFATRTLEVGDNINNGDLSNFLIKPINYLIYFFFKDLGDKAMNVGFSIIELTVIFVLLKPPFFLQTSPYYLVVFFIAIVISLTMYFLLSFLIGLIGFWSPETWGPRFIFFTLLTFLSGDLFPLDIMPQPLFSIAKILPFTYMLYFPIKIYLGNIDNQQILEGFLISIIWLIVIYMFTMFVWKKGLKLYTALGR